LDTGLYLRQLSRAVRRSRSRPGWWLQRGDLLRIVGRSPSCRRRQRGLAPLSLPTQASISSCWGSQFSSARRWRSRGFPIGSVKISLSTSIGALLAGLLVGHLRTHYPLFGRIPDGAVAFMTSLGLTAFVGLTGIHAGRFSLRIREAGIGLLLGGMVVTLLPQVIGLVLRSSGAAHESDPSARALAGAQTVDGAMARGPGALGSPVAVLGYTPAYTVANILLTIGGAIMVLVVAG